MNAGKLVAQIAVVAIVVYFTYTAVVAAVPTDVRNFNDVFNVSEDFSVNTETVDSGMNMKVTVNGAVTTKLPQNLEGVYIDVYMGDITKRTQIAHADIGTIKAKDTTPINASSTIPTYAVLAYAVTGLDKDGNITVPLVLSFGFKYMEWYGVYLVDLGMDLKQNLKIATGVSTPEKGAGDGDSSAKLKVVIDDTTGDTMYGIAKGLIDEGKDTFTLKTGDPGAAITVKLTDDGSKMSISINAAGVGDKSAVDLLKEAVGEDGLTLMYGDEAFTVNKENAAAFIELVTELYRTAGVEP